MVLIILGVNRFLLSVLSAGLPQIIRHERLLVANSIMPTLGGAATAVGVGLGLLLRLLIPVGIGQDIGSLTIAAGLYALAAGVVTRLGRSGSTAAWESPRPSRPPQETWAVPFATSCGAERPVWP